MNPDHSTQERPEPLTSVDLQMVERLLALCPTSSQLIAALHETFAREAIPRTPAIDAAHCNTAPDEMTLAADSSADLGPTLHERARQIDPRTGGCCNAFWGEWISAGQRTVGRALCWYPVPDQFDVVPDWAMRDAWPEHANSWEDLIQTAWDRRQLGRTANGDLPF